MISRLTITSPCGDRLLHVVEEIVVVGSEHVGRIIGHCVQFVHRDIITDTHSYNLDTMVLSELVGTPDGCGNIQARKP